MQILFLGSFFPDSKKEEIIKNSKGVIQNAGDTYQKSILNGLCNYYKNIEIITSPMIGSYPFRYKKALFRGCNFKYKNLNNCLCTSFINIPFYKIQSRYFQVKKELNKWAVKNSSNKYIILFSLDLSLLKAACEIKEKNSEIKICLIVTDLYRFMVVPKSFLSKSIMQYFEKKSLKYIEEVDSFVLLTQYMKDDLLVGERPFVIIEGIYYDINSINTGNCNKEHYKTILYTGTLAKQYGIDRKSVV